MAVGRALRQKHNDVWEDVFLGPGVSVLQENSRFLCTIRVQRPCQLVLRYEQDTNAHCDFYDVVCIDLA